MFSTHEAGTPGRAIQAWTVTYTDPLTLLAGEAGQTERRPDMHSCILFADHFGVNPNEFLQLAGWPTLKAFDIHSASAENLPPEAVDVAMDVARIPDPGTRKQVAEAIRTLLVKYLEV